MQPLYTAGSEPRRAARLQRARIGVKTKPMNVGPNIKIFGIGAEDIAYVLRALVTRPGDIPGILRREAARRRANLPTTKPDDADGLRVLTNSWQAALSAKAFRAPPGTGPALRIASLDPLPDVITALQTASSVHWGPVTSHPAFGAISLEASRLSLPQSADQPEMAMAARQATVEAADLSTDLRTELLHLTDHAITT